MVLQQKHEVPIWGTAEPGEAVTVTFAGQKRTVVAGADGKWRVDLGKFDASFDAANNDRSRERIRSSSRTFWSARSGWFRASRICSGVCPSRPAAARRQRPRIIRIFVSSTSAAKSHSKGSKENSANGRPARRNRSRNFRPPDIISASRLQQELKVPIGLINSSYGGSQAEAWTPVEYLNASPDLKPTVDRTEIWAAEREQVRVEYAEAIKKWREDSDKAKAAGARPSPSPGVPDALRDYRIASSIYDGMIEPLMPFAIRGAIWYQGESNEARAEQYNILLPTMIRAWRERWGQGDFPFGIIQLAELSRRKSRTRRIAVELPPRSPAADRAQHGTEYGPDRNDRYWRGERYSPEKQTRCRKANGALGFERCVRTEARQTRRYLKRAR